MARDIIHNAVKQALVNDGWIITADPFHLQYEEFNLFADLAAERSPIAAIRENQRILVEVKSFAGISFVRELQQAVGQYEMYWQFMQVILPDHHLLMAVSDVIYYRYFEQKAVQYLIDKMKLALVVIDIEKEQVIQWINWEPMQN